MFKPKIPTWLSLTNKSTEEVRKTYALWCLVLLFFTAGAVLFLTGLPKNPVEDEAYLTDRQIVARNIVTISGFICLMMAVYFWGRRSELSAIMNDSGKYSEKGVE